MKEKRKRESEGEGESESGDVDVDEGERLTKSHEQHSMRASGGWPPFPLDSIQLPHTQH